MRHETLEKLYAVVKAKREEPLDYDIWLTDDTANQLMAEAYDVKLREGTLVLLFNDADADVDVVISVGGGMLLTEDVDCYVKVLRIRDDYVHSKKDTGKKDCVHL